MKEKIKVLYTISNFDTAGSGKVVYDLAKGINKEKFDVHIACSKDTGALFASIEELNLPIHIFNTKTNYKPYISLPFRIFKLVSFFRKHKFDLVHSWQWSSDWTEAVATKMAGSKWIYTKKAMGFNNRHWKIKSKMADFIITINDEMKQYFPKKKKQKLIPLGIDTVYYSPNQLNKKNNSSDEFKIVMVANLVPVKGLEVLLEAIKSLNNSKYKLLILGNTSNSYGEKMRQLVKKLGIENQVNFSGKKEDVRPYILESDLFIIPTLDQGRKEGMPMALVEAMSLGMPVLGSNITGIKYVLKDFQELLFEAGNSEELSSKISNFFLKSDQERKIIGEQLRNFCLKNYKLEQFLEAHEDLYESLIFRT